MVGRLRALSAKKYLITGVAVNRLVFSFSSLNSCLPYIYKSFLKFGYHHPKTPAGLQQLKAHKP